MAKVAARASLAFHLLGQCGERRGVRDIAARTMARSWAHHVEPALMTRSDWRQERANPYRIIRAELDQRPKLWT